MYLSTHVMQRSSGFITSHSHKEFKEKGNEEDDEAWRESTNFQQNHWHQRKYNILPSKMPKLSPQWIHSYCTKGERNLNYNSYVVSRFCKNDLRIVMQLQQTCVSGAFKVTWCRLIIMSWRFALKWHNVVYFAVCTVPTAKICTFLILNLVTFEGWGKRTKTYGNIYFELSHHTLQRMKCEFCLAFSLPPKCPIHSYI